MLPRPKSISSTMDTSSKLKKIGSKCSALVFGISVSTVLLGSQSAPLHMDCAKPVHAAEKVADKYDLSTKSRDIFNQQLTLLDNSLNNVEYSDPSEIEWYFVGVAGYAGQNVFRSETNYAKQLFDDNFNTQGRSIALINNQYSLYDEPIATKGSIQKALYSVGKKMGEEDVLFLSMSSHGNQNVFQLDNYVISLDNIDPDWLRETLDNAGIKWRVIAISSCFSGSFIDELMTPTTAIITAAAEDKASFGCTQTAKMTYFGEAFYTNNLADATSLNSAYKNASAEIKARELAEGFTPSDPQMVVGKAMKAQLPAFEKVLFQ